MVSLLVSSGSPFRLLLGSPLLSIGFPFAFYWPLRSSIGFLVGSPLCSIGFRFAIHWVPFLFSIVPALYFSIGSPFVSLLVSRSPLVYYWVGFYCFLLGPLRFYIVPPCVLMGSPSFLDWDLLHFSIGFPFVFYWVPVVFFSMGGALVPIGPPSVFYKTKGQ